MSLWVTMADTYEDDFSLTDGTGSAVNADAGYPTGVLYNGTTATGNTVTFTNSATAFISPLLH